MSTNLPAQKQRGGDIFQSLFGWDPFRPMFAQNAWPGGIDINRSESGYDVELPVPGFRPEEIDVTVQDNVLMISGKSDRRQFTRTLILPDDVDPDDTSAHVENGLLSIHLSRRPEARPRRIEVRAGSAERGGSKNIPSVSGTLEGSSTGQTTRT